MAKRNRQANIVLGCPEKIEKKGMLGVKGGNLAPGLQTSNVLLGLPTTTDAFDSRGYSRPAYSLMLNLDTLILSEHHTLDSFELVDLIMTPDMFVLPLFTRFSVPLLALEVT